MTDMQNEPGAEQGCQHEDRRRFFARISYACGAGIAALISVPVIGQVLAPLFGKPPKTWRDVGGLADFEVGKTVKVEFEDASPLPWAGVTARTAAWLRRLSETEFEAFSVNCRHLGCPVRWVEGAELFLCPCHGGVYYKDGTVAAGPPPQPLHKYPVRVHEGRVQIQASPIPLAS